MFRVEFYTDYCDENMADFLPFDDNTTGNFCVYENWDQGFALITRLTCRMPDKPYIFNDMSNNGVPSFYSSKPPTAAEAAKKTNKKTKKSKSQKPTGRQPCSFWGKKRHVKGSGCPGANKAKKGK